MSNNIYKIKNTFRIENSKLNDNGDYVVSGYFKVWKNRNFNGERYTTDAYDEFINSYFEKNEFNVPINLLHQKDIFHLVGKVDNMIKDDIGIYLDVIISKHAIYFEKVVGMIEDKILQGFSDEGFATNWDEDEDGVLIRQAILERISLVDLPAEVDAKLEIENATKFKGFKHNDGLLEIDRDKEKINNRPDFL